MTPFNRPEGIEQGERVADTPHVVAIHITPDGFGTTVAIDGREMLTVRTVNVSAGIDGPSVVTLELIAAEVTIDGAVGLVRDEPAGHKCCVNPTPPPLGVSMQNRRELLKAVMATADAAGVAVKAQEVSAEAASKPALVLLECAHPIRREHADRLSSTLKDRLKGTAFEGLPVIVTDDGLRLTILGSDGTTLNRPLVEPISAESLHGVDAVVYREKE